MIGCSYIIKGLNIRIIFILNFDTRGLKSSKYVMVQSGVTKVVL